MPRLEPHMNRQPARRQRGFTLLEVLVAFAILALTLGVLFQAWGTTVRGAGRAQHYLDAVTVAESVLARLGRELALDAGELQGAEGRYHWTLSVRHKTGAGDVAREGPDLYAVELRVSWSDGHAEQSLELKSLRLKPAVRTPRT